MDIWEFNHYVFGVLLALLLVIVLVSVVFSIVLVLKSWIKKAMEWFNEEWYEGH